MSTISTERPRPAAAGPAAATKEVPAGRAATLQVAPASLAVRPAEPSPAALPVAPPAAQPIAPPALPGPPPPAAPARGDTSSPTLSQPGGGAAAPGLGDAYSPAGSSASGAGGALLAVPSSALLPDLASPAGQNPATISSAALTRLLGQLGLSEPQVRFLSEPSPLFGPPDAAAREPAESARPAPAEPAFDRAKSDPERATGDPGADGPGRRADAGDRAGASGGAPRDAAPAAPAPTLSSPALALGPQGGLLALAQLGRAQEAGALDTLQLSGLLAASGAATAAAAEGQGAPSPPAAGDGGWGAAIAAHLGGLADGSLRLLPAAQAGEARPLVAADLGAAEALRQLVQLSGQPPGGVALPILSAIAADLSRLSGLRQEIVAGLRVPNEDGELPPQDEDEAMMRRRQVQGVGRGSMWASDRKPADAAEPPEQAAASLAVALRAALVTCALQAPHPTLTMFHATRGRRGVRLYRPAGPSWRAQWVHLPPHLWGPVGGSAAPPSEPAQLAAWLALVEQAAAQLQALQPLPPLAPEAPASASAARALAMVAGREAGQWPGTAGGEGGLRQAWQVVVQAATGRRPTLLCTAAEVADARLAANMTYGVLGAGLAEGRAQVVLCEVVAPAPPAAPAGAGAGGAAAPPWRLQVVSWPALAASLAGLAQLSAAAAAPRGS